MNGVFAAMFFASLLSFLIFDPEGFLPALLAGGEKAVSLSLSLAAAYCVWLGFFGVMEQSGLTALFARTVRPAARRLFRSDDEKALSAACCSVSANLLSLPGAPTPLGIEATRRFLEGGNPFGAHMLFVLNAAGVQLFSTTALSFPLAAGAASPAGILLPTLLATPASPAAAAWAKVWTRPMVRSSPSSADWTPREIRLLPARRRALTVRLSARLSGLASRVLSWSFVTC